jgi:hypothetical protein
MRNGDISNQVTPRIVLVFEGALGFVFDEKLWQKVRKNGKYYKIRECWGLNELMVHRILWLFHKKDLQIDIVTFLGDDFAAELTEWLEDEGVTVSDVWSSTVTQLARSIVYMPDLALVYDPEPTRWLTYGSKGMFISDVNQLGAF